MMDNQKPKHNPVAIGLTVILIGSLLYLANAIKDNTESQQALFQSNTVIIEGMQHILSTHEMMK